MKRKSQEEIRKEKNKELLERMDDPNDSLTNGLTKENILFPKRSVIKKDKKIVAELFGENNDSIGQ